MYQRFNFLHTCLLIVAFLIYLFAPLTPLFMKHTLNGIDLFEFFFDQIERIDFSFETIVFMICVTALPLGCFIGALCDALHTENNKIRIVVSAYPLLFFIGWWYLQLTDFPLIDTISSEGFVVLLACILGALGLSITMARYPQNETTDSGFENTPKLSFYFSQNERKHTLTRYLHIFSEHKAALLILIVLILWYNIATIVGLYSIISTKNLNIISTVIRIVCSIALLYGIYDLSRSFGSHIRQGTRTVAIAYLAGAIWSFILVQQVPWKLYESKFFLFCTPYITVGIETIGIVGGWLLYRWGETRIVKTGGCMLMTLFCVHMLGNFVTSYLFFQELGNMLAINIVHQYICMVLALLGWSLILFDGLKKEQPGNSPVTESKN